MVLASKAAAGQAAASTRVGVSSPAEAATASTLPATGAFEEGSAVRSGSQLSP